MKPLRQLWVILKKDIIMEMRTKEMIVSMLMFVMLTMIIFNYAFRADRNDLTPFGGGLLWLAFIYTAFLGMNRSFVHEKDQGCLEGLLLSPVDRSIIYVAKMVGNLIFLTAVELLAVPIFTMFFISYPYYLHLDKLGIFLLGLGLSNFGIAAVGTFVATMAVNTQRRDLLLPILGLPLLMPVVAPAVMISGTMLSGSTSKHELELVGESLKILAAYDIIFFVVIAMIYDFILGE